MGPAFYIPSLDGIRAVSITVVFVAHAGLTIVPGGLGVTAFFFLSGYLITTLLRREFEANGKIAYREFYWRRAWRIFPPMYAALALGVLASVLGLTGTVRPTLRGIALQGLHLSNYGQLTSYADEIPRGTGVYWSLAVEEHFYLVFPVCAVFLMRRFTRRTQSAVVLGACALVLLWRVVLVQAFNAVPDRTYLATDTRIDAILFGCAMGLYFNPVLDNVPKPKASVAAIASLGALAVIVCSVAVRGELYQTTFRYSLQSLALLPLFFFAIQRPTLWLFRPLNWRWVKFIGLMSYSFYLVHHVVLYIIYFSAPEELSLYLTVLAAPVSLGSAYLISLAVERPAAKIRERYAVPLDVKVPSVGSSRPTLGIKAKNQTTK